MTPDPGISQALARDRAARVRDLEYSLRIVVPPDPDTPLRATAVVVFTLLDASSPLVLDFAPNTHGKIWACACDGHALRTTAANGHIIVPPDALQEGRVSLRFDFDMGDGPINRRLDYLYTVFVPARAHEALPCFDQPDLKARWSLTLDLPDSWLAVSNGAELTREPHLDDAGHPSTTVSFATTEPLPTYLFAFAAGHFSVEPAESSGRTFRLFHRETDRTLLERNASTIADLHAEALAWLERYTAIPYPFGKLDIVVIPDFQFGGMEHPGAIFYNAAGLLLDASATRQQMLARASVIAHEAAHMWFGDLVTMRWFDDVWMKEVFANFMAAKIVNPSFPDLDHDLRFLHAHYPGAYDVDRTAGTNPIRQPLENLLDAGSLYGAIIYLKSPIVMRQLERLVGVDVLQAGVRRYLQRHAFGNASWPDLLAVLEESTSLDVRRWSRDWIDEAGRPTIRARLSRHDGAVAQLSLETVDTKPERRLRWPQRLDVALGYASLVEHVTVDLDGAANVIEARGMRSPDYVLPNGRGVGYGQFEIDDASLAWLLERLPDIGDALTRGSAWLTLWDAMLGARVAPLVLARSILAALPREASELNALRLMAWLERIFWVFLSEHERAGVSSDLEARLKEGLAAAGTVSLRAAWFATLRAVATTPAAVAWLRDVWARAADVPGLPLGETDLIVLTQELAVRDVDAGTSLVRTQMERTANEERQAALSFVAPALSQDEHERDRFFERLRNVEHRRREPWVLDGLRWLHHPLRQATSIRYLEPGLNLLEDVRRTGDIFLPKRWADATLGSYGSTEAAQAVHRFLGGLPPSYPPALARIVLASADQLFRAAGAPPALS